jgi:hypothetical protein
MVFDKTQPTNTTKIRNLGVVIRPNWQAIEEADATFKPQAINFPNRTVLGIAVDPPAIADTMVLYCKTNSGGNTVMYAKDPASRISQITGSVQPVRAVNGYTWLPGGMMMQWGLAHANGSANTAIGFPIAFSAAPYSITTNFYRTSGSTSMKPLDIVSGSVNINNFTVWNANGGHDFFFIAVGPKV